ncbi:bridge-like lipid transfer protein family member 2 [Petromyzon marinus]|uniref:bridge-like lipid transfer protein family member 2 n=1 Tax=Petromyzon marinus TaxID=7757 RepID=UPI003F70A768
MEVVVAVVAVVVAVVVVAVVAARLLGWLLSCLLHHRLGAKFKIGSVGLLSVNNLTLQPGLHNTLEIDKVWLSCRLFNPGLPRPFALCLREVRLRLDLSPCPAPDVSTATPAGPASGHTPPAPAANQRRPLLIRALAQVCSVQVESVSVMLLHALVPGALTHTTTSTLSVLLSPSTTGMCTLHLSLSQLNSRMLKSSSQPAELCVAELCLSLSLTAQLDLTSLKVATLDLRLGKLVAGLHGVATFDPEAEGGVATPHAGRPPPSEEGGWKVTTSDLMARLPELTSVQVNNVSVTATLAVTQQSPVVMATRLVECRLTLCPHPPQPPRWGEGPVGGGAGP